MFSRLLGRAPEEFPTGPLADVVHEAAKYAEELQTEFAQHPGFADLDVYVSAGRPKCQRECNVHLNAVLLQWPSERTVELLDETVLLMRKPDAYQPWQQVAEPQQARDRVRLVLQRWVAMQD